MTYGGRSERGVDDTMLAWKMVGVISLAIVANFVLAATVGWDRVENFFGLGPSHRHYAQYHAVEAMPPPLVEDGFREFGGDRPEAFTSSHWKGTYRCGSVAKRMEMDLVSVSHGGLTAKVALYPGKSIDDVPKVFRVTGTDQGSMIRLRDGHWDDWSHDVVGEAPSGLRARLTGAEQRTLTGVIDGIACSEFKLKRIGD